MLLVIPDVLTQDEVQHCRTIMKQADWQDGLATAGALSAQVKQNRQLPIGSEPARLLGNIVLTALSANPLFLSAALPLRILPPMFNRYAGGEYFGVHVDNAIRTIPQSGTQIRTDLSMTLFFSEPEEYEGGELHVETQFGSNTVKLEAGSMVLYPATSLHQVTPVTAGERLSSFFWLQSMIRDEQCRTMLFDLDQTIQSLAGERGLQDPACVKLSGIYHNLIRQWAEM